MKKLASECVKKRGLLIAFFALIMLIINNSFIVSGYSIYSSSSLSEFFSLIDPATLFLSAIFIVSFFLINFALSKTFHDQKPIATIISFVIAFIITWQANQSNLDYEGFFYDVGISGDLLYIVLLVVLLAGLIYLWKKIGKEKALLIFGILFIVAGSTNLVYEKEASILIGIVLLVVGGIMLHNKTKEDRKKKEEAEKVRNLFSRIFNPSRI